MTYVPFIQGTGLAAWTMLNRTRDQQQDAFEQSPQFARDIQTFKDRIGSIQTADDLMNDWTMLRVSLGAFGLDEDINNRAFIRQVLESDMADETSFANRLSDKRYAAMATTFGFNTASGPQINSTEPAFASVRSVDDLLSDGTALRTALGRFGLESDENNVFFLQSILESDVNDPDSFVNQLRDTRYLAFREAFDFSQTDALDNRTSDFYFAFKDKIADLETADDLLADSALVEAATAFFDLPTTNTTRLRLALTSDTTNPDSVVNQLGDARYVAFSEAFGFGYPDIDTITDPEVLLANSQLRADSLDLFDLSDPGDDVLRDALNSDLDDPGSFVNQADYLYLSDFVEAFQNDWPETDSKAKAFVDTIAEDIETIRFAEDVVFNLDLYDATLDIFGLTERTNDRIYIQRVLETDTTAPDAMTNFIPDQRYTALAKAFDFNGPAGSRVYPQGFADAVTQNYADRQFEVQIGNTDQNLRLALSFERELTSVVDGSGTNDARWFSVMANQPLRTMFETVFQLPTSFGTLDLDRQLDDFKARSQVTFGTSDLRDLLTPDNVDAVRNRFLALSQITDQQAALTSGNTALQLLSRI